MSERDMLQSNEGQDSKGLETQADNSKETRSLEEATHDPGTRVEERGNIQEAEAIEANLVQMVEAQNIENVEGQGLSAEDFEKRQEYQQESKGGKSSFGSETSDPKKHYAGVEMKQGEVLQDDDWNEEEGVPQSLETSFEEIDGIRQEGLEELTDIQASKEKSSEEEEERLKEKFGSDEPRSKEETPNELAEEENEEESLALQMRMDKKESEQKTRDLKHKPDPNTAKKIIDNLK